MSPEAFWPGLFTFLAVVIPVVVATVGSYFGYKMWLTAKGWELLCEFAILKTLLEVLCTLANISWYNLRLQLGASSVETDPPGIKKPVRPHLTSEPLSGSVEPSNNSSWTSS